MRRWLADPSGVQGALWNRLCNFLGDAVETAAPVAVSGFIVAVVLVCGRWWRRRRLWRRARAGARWVEVEPPSISETADGQEMWRQLVGLLRPGALGAWARLLVWELHAGAEQVRAGVWVPGTVDAEDVVEAVAASYRRCRVQVRLPDRPQQAAEGVRTLPSAGYVVVPRTSMWQPLLAETPVGSGRVSSHRRGSGGTSVDPLDGLWWALAATPRGYRMVVQVMVRPPTRRTRAQARSMRSAAGERAGRARRRSWPELLLAGISTLVTQVLVAVLETITPGPPSRATPARPSGQARVQHVDPITQQERRTAALKASAELVEICVRVAAVGPDRARCRELAWRAANSLRRVITAQGTDTIRIPDGGRRVQGRVTGNGPAIRLRGPRPGHARGWFVATDTELGALARLPHRPAWVRFVVAGAPQLPAPLGLPRLDTPGPGGDGSTAGEVA